MRIEILTTGTELLLGSTANTHGTWLGQELSKLGLRVQRQITVPDGDAIEMSVAECVPRCDVLIVTGGLGPTSDDITREAVAKVLELELMEDESVVRHLHDFFSKRGKEMLPTNLKQAQVPVGADVLANPNGTAPGIYLPPRLSRDACAVFLLPGPPRELYPMYHEEVKPRLVALAGIESRKEMVELKFAGVGESEMQQLIDGRLAGIDGLEHGYCARLGEVDLRLIGSREVLSEARRIALDEYEKEWVSDDGASLEGVVVRALAEKGWKLATAESCTGGLIANRITDIPGASEVFTHGFVTYANEAKVELIGVSADDLRSHGAVSEPVARQMAEGALEKAAADLAVSVTGIAGPAGGSEEKPVGTVFLGLAMKGRETEVFQECHPRNRLDFKLVVSQRALDLVRLALRD